MASFRNLRPIAAVSVALLLSACSGGPSASEVRGAIEGELDRMNEEIEMMAGARMAARVGKYELTGFELVGCESAGEAYQCDVVYSMDTPLMPFNDKAVTLRLRESDRGWIVMGGGKAMVLGGIN